jgi:hypothetical protein
MAKKPSVVNRMTKIKVVTQRTELFPTRPVNCKLTHTERKYLDMLVFSRQYPTRSAALRAGLGLLMEKHGLDDGEGQQIERERRHHAPRMRRSAK